MKRSVQKISPSQRSTFDQQRWPVLVAITVLAGIALGAVLTISSAPWRMAGLVALPVVVGGIVYLLYRLDNERVRRSLQFSIIVSLAAHLLLLVLAAITNVFQNPFEVPERQVARQQIRSIEISDRRASFVWEEPNSRETPEPKVEAVKQKQSSTSQRPQTIPLENATPNITPQLTKRRPSNMTVPRRQRELSELKRQLQDQTLRSIRKSVALKSESTKIQTPATESETKPVEPVESLASKAQVAKQKQTSEAKPKSELAKLLDVVPSTESPANTRPAEPQRRRSEISRTEITQTNANTNSLRSTAKSPTIRPTTASESIATNSPANRQSQSAKTTLTANSSAEEVAKSSNKSQKPQRAINTPMPEASSPVERQATLVRREIETRNDASIFNAASTSTQPRRATKELALAASPSAFESPARRPESSDNTPELKSKTLSISRGVGGVVGTGQSKNLDKFLGGTPSPARVASNSAKRKRTLSKRSAERMLTSSQQSRSRRLSGPSLSPTSVFKADTTSVAKLSGMAKPSNESTESSAANISAPSTNNRDDRSAEKGESSVDLGPIKIVQDRSSRRLSGGGQPQVARLNPEMTRRSRDQSNRQPTLDARADIEVGAPRSLSSKPASIPAATESNLAAVAKRSGGRRSTSAKTLATSELGELISPEVGGPVDGAAGSLTNANTARRKSEISSSDSGRSSSLFATKSVAASATKSLRGPSQKALPTPSGGVGDLEVASITSSSGKSNSIKPTAESKDVSVARQSVRSTENTVAKPSELAGFKVDVDAELGPSGLSVRPSDFVGVRTRPAAQDSRQLMPDLTSRFRRPEFGGAPAINPDAVFAVDAFRLRSPKSLSRVADPTTEAAIQLGLEWLARNQALDGSWTLTGFDRDSNLSVNGLDSDTAATGLALLAFQGAGYNHREYKYARQLDLAVQWLIENQSPNGDLYVSSDNRSDSACHLYSHGIATLALTEAYGMTQDPRLKEAAQSAIRFIEANQDARKGGWRYFVDANKRSTDTSVSGWMMMALHSGRMAGLEVDQKTFQGIEDWLVVAAAPDTQSKYRYNPYAVDTKGVSRVHGKNPTTSMTAVGLLMQIYNGWEPSDARLIAGANYLVRNQLPDDSSIQNRDTYYWYYATQVVKYVDGEPWKKWNARLRPLLTRSQIKTGDSAGSWHPYKPVPDRWGRFGGRLYVTALNLMSLEVRHRMLPLYRQKKPSDDLLGFIEGGKFMIAENDNLANGINSRAIVETSLRKSKTSVTETLADAKSIDLPDLVAASRPSEFSSNSDLDLTDSQLSLSAEIVKQSLPENKQPPVRHLPTLPELAANPLAFRANFDRRQTNIERANGWLSKARSSTEFSAKMTRSELVRRSVESKPLASISKPKIDRPFEFSNSLFPAIASAGLPVDELPTRSLDQLAVTHFENLQPAATRRIYLQTEANTKPALPPSISRTLQKLLSLEPLTTFRVANSKRKTFRQMRLNSKPPFGFRSLPIDAARPKLKRKLDITFDPIEIPKLASTLSKSSAASPRLSFGQVVGKITLDGEPLDGARVRFAPTDKSQGSPIVGLTNSAGQYSILNQNTRSGRGIAAGKYQISITTVVESPDVRTIDLLEIVPKNYNIDSRLEATIEPGKTQTINFDLESSFPINK